MKFWTRVRRQDVQRICEIAGTANCFAELRCRWWFERLSASLRGFDRAPSIGEVLNWTSASGRPGCRIWHQRTRFQGYWCQQKPGSAPESTWGPEEQLKVELDGGEGRRRKAKNLSAEMIRSPNPTSEDAFPGWLRKGWTFYDIMGYSWLIMSTTFFLFTQRPLVVFMMSGKKETFKDVLNQKYYAFQGIGFMQI